MKLTDATPTDTLKPDVKPLRIVFISGLSGAGKTLALKTLEDLEYFSIDNLPASLLDPLVLLLEQNAEISRVALVMDARDPQFPRQAEKILVSLRARGHEVRLLFLEASTQALIRRFAETRRPHPMGRRSSVEKGVARELKALSPLREQATEIVDTTAYNVHQLRAALVALVKGEKATPVRLILSSFGFKYGLPMEAAFVFDVRYLPNPFFVEELRPLTGRDSAVSDYVLAQDNAGQIAHQIASMVTLVLPLCRKEGRSSLMVAVGCTGGQHRSVAICEEVARLLLDHQVKLTIQHRDIGRTAG